MNTLVTITPLTNKIGSHTVNTNISLQSSQALGPTIKILLNKTYTLFSTWLALCFFILLCIGLKWQILISGHSALIMLPNFATSCCPLQHVFFHSNCLLVCCSTITISFRDFVSLVVLFMSWTLASRMVRKFQNGKNSLAEESTWKLVCIIPPQFTLF